MNFAVCNELFQDWPFDKAFALARELGYTGVEIAPFTIEKYATDISAARRAQVQQQAEGAGLEVVGLHWLLAQTEGFYLTSPDPAVREKTSDYFSELAQLCCDLGGSVMVLGSPMQRNLLPGVSHDEALRYAADVIAGAVSRLDQCGVTLAIEPLGPSEGDFLNTAAQAIRMIQMIDSPRVRLHLDVKAMSSEPTPMVDIIRQGAPYLAHFHANDPNKRGPGMGDVDFIPIFQALREVDYRGWVSVEVFDYEPGIERLAGDSIRYMQHCLRQIA